MTFSTLWQSDNVKDIGGSWFSGFLSQGDISIHVTACKIYLNKKERKKEIVLLAYSSYSQNKTRGQEGKKNGTPGIIFSFLFFSFFLSFFFFCGEKEKELFIQKLYKLKSNDLMSSSRSQSPLEYPQMHTVLPSLLCPV